MGKFKEIMIREGLDPSKVNLEQMEQLYSQFQERLKILHSIEFKEEAAGLLPPEFAGNGEGEADR